MDAREFLFQRIFFPFYEGILRRRHTLRYRKEYERNQWLPTPEIAALQWSKLQRLVEHCWWDVPYYRRRWTALGITPADIRSPEDFARLPILTKSEIRENFEDLHATSWRDRTIYKATGGSTGEPLRFGYTRESYERRMAVMWRGYAWAGARMGRRTLYLWGGAVGNPDRRQALKERLYHFAFNRRMLDVFEMSEARMSGFADEIRRFRPAIIVGYAGPLDGMAAWMLRTGQTVPAPESIISAAEALQDFQRERIECAFGCPVYNSYGCREFMLIASQCAECGNLHVNADHLVVELDGAQANPDGTETGEVIISDLHNWGMPLLRYANGDVATRDTQRTHRCGRGLPTLKSIDGRKLDMLRTKDGRLLPGEYFPHLLKDIPGIVRFQVIQERIDSFTLNIVAGAEFASDQEAMIRNDVARLLGTSVILDIRRVDEIPLTPSGKMRVTICRLP